MLLDFSSLRLGIVLLSVLPPLILGFFWYGPMFGKIWMKDNHLTEGDIRKSPVASIFTTSLGALFISALFTGIVIQGLSVNFSKLEALTTALLLGIGFAATTLAITYPYARKTWRLLLIDAGYIVSSYALIGLVFGTLA